MKNIKSFESFVNENLINEARTKDELLTTLDLLEGKLKKWNGVRQNSIHPFDPQKKVSDYVAYLKQSIGYVKAELAELQESKEVNESKKYKGREVLPNWIDPKRDFGAPVKALKDLQPGAEYILWEPGMDTWQAEFIYQGQTGGEHIFNDSNKEADTMSFSEPDLLDYIKSGDIIKQN